MGWRTSLTFLACAGVTVTAVPLGILAPFLSRQFNLTVAQVGQFALLRGLGGMASVLFLAALARRLSREQALATGTALLGAAMAGLGAAPSWVWFLVLIAALGATQGIVETLANAQVGVFYGDRRGPYMAGLHALCSLAGMVAPVLIGRCLAQGAAWQAVPAAIGAAVFGVGAAYLVLLRLATVPAEAEATDPEGGVALCPAMPGTWFVNAGLFCWVGGQFGLAMWLPTYALRVLGASLIIAGLAVTTVWLGITVGRLANSWLLRYLSEPVALSLLPAGAALAMLAAVRAPTGDYATFLAACLLTGVMGGGTFPLAYSAVSGGSSAQATRAASLLSLANYGGQMFLPWLIGVVSAGAGLERGVYLIPALMLLSGACFGVFALSIKKRRGVRCASA